MKSAFIPILVCAVLLTILIFAAFIVWLRRHRRGISKDYAEQIAMRRFSQGQTIGARFTKNRRRWTWEFDVLDGTGIHRVWVDGRSGQIVMSHDLPPAESYLRNKNQPLGKRID